jgi:pimeloyl-ACP methyl ester carboxylesterase
LRADLYKGQHRDLLVSFDFRRLRKSAGFAPLNFSNHADRAGFAQLRIRSTRNDWFINRDTTPLEAALTSLQGRFRRVHMIGYSMGGYGALRFARALNADQIVAVSPQYSISRQVVPFETRVSREARKFYPKLGELAAVVHPGLRGAIVGDPVHPADLLHADMIKLIYPDLDLVRLGFGGHPATKVMREAQNQGMTHRQATRRGVRRRSLIRAHRRSRRSSATYWSGLAMRAGDRRPALRDYAEARAQELRQRSNESA